MPFAEWRSSAWLIPSSDAAFLWLTPFSCRSSASTREKFSFILSVYLSS